MTLRRETPTSRRVGLRAGKGCKDHVTSAEAAWLRHGARRYLCFASSRMNTITNSAPLDPVCIVLFGPHAVGKMTVGAALSERLGYPFVHHRDVHDLVVAVWGAEAGGDERLHRHFRTRICEEAIERGERGFVFSCVWDLDDDEHRAGVEEACGVFRRAGWRVLFVELAAPLEARVPRVRPPLRRLYERDRLDADVVAGKPLRWALGRFNSKGDFPYGQEHVVAPNEDDRPWPAVERVLARLSCDELNIPRARAPDAVA